MSEISISDKAYLTIKEASQYFNISESKLRDMVRKWKGKNNYNYFLMNGNKYLIKREKFMSYINKTNII